jgi:hypothetical protein
MFSHPRSVTDDGTLSLRSIRVREACQRWGEIDTIFLAQIFRIKRMRRLCYVCRFMNGAATNPDAHVFAYAAAQTKKVMEVTHRLGKPI